MVIKVVNSEHDWGEERGVMCSYDCTFTKVLLVKQIIACLRWIRLLLVGGRELKKDEALHPSPHFSLKHHYVFVIRIPIHRTQQMTDTLCNPSVKHNSWPSVPCANYLTRHYLSLCSLFSSKVIS